MFKENRGEGEIYPVDFTGLEGMEVKEDFVSVEDKISDLHNKIQLAEGAIAKAESLGDKSTVERVQIKLDGFRKALEELQALYKPKEEDVANILDFIGADDRKLERKEGRI